MAHIVDRAIGGIGSDAMDQGRHTLLLGSGDPLFECLVSGDSWIAHGGKRDILLWQLHAELLPESFCAGFTMAGTVQFDMVIDDHKATHVAIDAIHMEILEDLSDDAVQKLVLESAVLAGADITVAVKDITVGVPVGPLRMPFIDRAVHLGEIGTGDNLDAFGMA
ncbi:hypothetical protein SDC9_192723 [bioreactor metagenome]|uniref:Uncharacterized protein n=1 Tax=bioreactor metagenome TaxID=1076179 RepID=A0A645I2R3_9ZZZZ